MYNIPMILVKPIYGLKDGNLVCIGTQYLDDVLHIDSHTDNPVNDFLCLIDELVQNEQSIILYRQDVKQFANLVYNNEQSSKNIFKEIKCKLRANYNVFKLRHNPRTLEYYGINTAFIIHQNPYAKVQQKNLVE